MEGGSIFPSSHVHCYFCFLGFLTILRKRTNFIFIVVQRVNPKIYEKRRHKEKFEFVQQIVHTRTQIKKNNHQMQIWF